MKFKILLILAVFLGAAGCTKTVQEDNAPQLEIKVVDVEANPVGGARVTLYLNEEDWTNKLNKVVELTTGSLGTVLFEDMEEREYYFFVEKDQLTNRESASFIDTALQKNVRARVLTTIH